MSGKMVLMPVALGQGKKKRASRRKRKGGRQVVMPMLAGLPVGAKAKIGGRMMVHKGNGFFGDLWSGIKRGVSTVADVASSALPILKPVVSVAKNVLPIPGVVRGALDAVGLGRRRRRGGATRAYRAIKG